MIGPIRPAGYVNSQRSRDDAQGSFLASSLLALLPRRTVRGRMDTRASRRPRDRCREVVGADQCVTAQRSVWPAHPAPNASGAGYAGACDASTGPGSATTATVTLVAAGQAVAIIPGSPRPAASAPTSLRSRCTASSQAISRWPPGPRTAPPGGSLACFPDTQWHVHGSRSPQGGINAGMPIRGLRPGPQHHLSHPDS